ncbi:MAG: GNAT family N-acetyltransferase [Oligoflexales bacterium]|nr:GNAT family N-acetyltransferase [Oligoflexales bacterium]
MPELIHFDQSDKKNLQLFLNLRREVFVEEQQLPENLEFDDAELSKSKPIFYFIALEAGVVVSGGRVRAYAPRLWKVERVVTKQAARKRGLGNLIMHSIQDFCRNRDPLSLPILHSQADVYKFYEKLNWLPFGDEFLEAGIKHRRYVFIDPQNMQLKQLQLESKIKRWQKLSNLELSQRLLGNHD